MLTLICGLPRAGKTTYSERYDCKVFHLDEYGIKLHGYLRLNKKVDVNDDENIVVEGIYNVPSQRESLIRSYRGHGARCIWLDTSVEVKKKRKGYCPSCEYSFVPPTYDEGWDEIIIIKDNIEHILDKGGN